MRDCTIYLILSFCLIYALGNVEERERLPYGIKLKGLLRQQTETMSGDQLEIESIISSNVMNCECGLFSTSDEGLKGWEDEGVKTLNQYPWSASLVAPGGLYSFCGGSLVSDRYVLTSAACVDGSNAEGVEVLLKTWPFAHFSESEEPEKFNSTGLIRKKVVRVVLHPKYLDGHLDYNIALLRLKGPVPTFGEKNGVTHVCLPKIDDLVSGANASSLLWRFDQWDGAIIPKRRSEVNWRVMSQEECRAEGYNEQWKQMPESMMCAKIPKPSEPNHPYIDTYDCPGDAGGPLLMTRGHQKVQIGIDSWTACFGRPTGLDFSIGLFTRVSEFLDWMERHIGEDGRHCGK